MKNSIAILFLLPTLFSGSCRSISPAPICKKYESGKSLLSEIKESFENPENNILTIGYGVDQNEIILMLNNNQLVLYSEYMANQPISKQLLTKRQVEIFQFLDMEFLHGTDGDLSIIFKKQHRCHVLRYQASVDFESNPFRQKIENYKNGEKYDWIFPIEDQWFVTTDCD